jgi:protocatechuate 3,4-dioxygenase, alpha subunit
MVSPGACKEIMKMIRPDIPTDRVALTLEDTLGPYYPLQFLDGERMDLTCMHEGLVLRAGGTPILLRGHVFDIHGKLATGVLLEFWQADAAGRMRGPHNLGASGLDPSFEGFARCRVDGKFELKTVMPGRLVAEVAGETGRAPFITLTIFSDGISRLVTQIFFEGCEANAGDPVFASVPENLRERLLARRVHPDDAGIAVYEIDIRLAGDRETPFFDDTCLREE